MSNTAQSLHTDESRGKAREQQQLQQQKQKQHLPDSGLLNEKSHQPRPQEQPRQLQKLLGDQLPAPANSAEGGAAAAAAAVAVVVAAVSSDVAVADTDVSLALGPKCTGLPNSITMSASPANACSCKSPTLT
mmetsp:Transcript_33518/g.72573  ORF Transcript_33518/g.72573 Transcript_33518/m.72573 type:complete len:132 (-) Transcript_33518:1011-1406(-)